jgi:hypothetical protein
MLRLNRTECGQLYLLFGWARPCIPLADHLVRPEEEHRRNGEAQCLCRLEVDDQLELYRPLHRQLGGFRAFEDLVHEIGGAPVLVTQARPIRHETAGFGQHSVPVYRRQPTLCRKVDTPCSVIKGDRLCQNGEVISPSLAHRPDAPDWLAVCPLQLVVG